MELVGTETIEIAEEDDLDAGKPFLIFIFDSKGKYMNTCNSFDQDVLNKARVADIANDKFVCYKIDINNTDSKILKDFSIDKAPTFLFLTAQGKRIGKLSRNTTKVDFFVKAMNRALKVNEKSSKIQASK